jgi:hypothetical protein
MRLIPRKEKMVSRVTHDRVSDKYIPIIGFIIVVGPTTFPALMTANGAIGVGVSLSIVYHQDPAQRADLAVTFLQYSLSVRVVSMLPMFILERTRFKSASVVAISRRNSSKKIVLV